MSTDETRDKVGAFFVRHPQFGRVEREIRTMINLGRTEGEADCVLVTSPSGTGKTTLFRRLKKEYFDKNSKSRRIVHAPKSPMEVSAPDIPVLFYEVPSQPRPIALVQDLLKVLGDPQWNKGRLHDCCHRLDDFLEVCGTTCIVLDEVQRLVDRTGVITSETILEELKRLHGRHQLSLVFLGLGRIKYILEADPQLRDRWSLEFRLQGFQCYRYEVQGQKTVKVQEEEQWRNWRGILKSLQEQTGLITSEPLSSDEYAERLYYATAGILRRLKKLLRRSLMLLGERGGGEVSLQLLGEAYEDMEKGGLNPFKVASINALPLPTVDDDYKLNASPKKRREWKSADARSENAGSTIIRALRGK